MKELLLSMVAVIMLTGVMLLGSDYVPERAVREHSFEERFGGSEFPTLQDTRHVVDFVDDYLWEVYQRVPVKKDKAGDFTWKDLAAARRVSMSVQQYVIGGMDPNFREQLYHAGKAMDAAGLQWAIMSAFRDDYRQGIARGFKAPVGGSLHGGSHRTGGYGHGRAVDIVAVGDNSDDVYRWIDKHGGEYGLVRPAGLRRKDPAHVEYHGVQVATASVQKQTRRHRTAQKKQPGFWETVFASNTKPR